MRNIIREVAVRFVANVENRVWDRVRGRAWTEVVSVCCVASVWGLVGSLVREQCRGSAG